MLTIRSGDDRTFYASEATLSQCTYFRNYLDRWDNKKDLILDMDGDSLSVILSLLRYGKETCKSVITEELRVKILKDVEYLGVPEQLWVHLKDEYWYTYDVEYTFNFDTCKKCRQSTFMTTYKCKGCNNLLENQRIFIKNATYTNNILYTYCKKCRRGQFVEKSTECIYCPILEKEKN